VAAVAAAREAARAATRGGQSAVALRALHDAVRLGDTRATDGVLALDIDCMFARLTLDHARALKDGDEIALASVAKNYSRCGYSRAI